VGPPNGIYRAPTGAGDGAWPKQKLPTLQICVCAKNKTRAEHPRHANVLALFLVGDVGIWHGRPQDPGRARAGPVSDPGRFPTVSAAAYNNRRRSYMSAPPPPLPSIFAAINLSKLRYAEK